MSRDRDQGAWQLLRGAVIAVVVFNCSLPAYGQWHLITLWNRVGLTDSSFYGAKVLPLGDQNADGYADWAVYADRMYYAMSRHPYIEFFHGGNPPWTTPYRTIHSDSTGAWRFRNVGALGDVNGDGFVDYFLSRSYFTIGQVISIYSGGPVTDTTAVLVLTTRIMNDFCPIGDFNGDRYTDFAIYNWYDRFTDIYFGGPSMDTIPDWTRHSPAGHPGEPWPYYFGDLNGDGFSDWISRGDTGSNIYVFLGSANPDTIPAFVWTGMPYGPIGVVHSLNGDGCDEIITRDSTWAHVYFGNVSLDSIPDARLYFPRWPRDAVSAGDVNEDGYDDFLMVQGGEGYGAGWLTLHLGHPWLAPQPVFGMTFSSINAATTAGVGDINGDGVNDFAFGGYHGYMPDGMRGWVSIYSGDSSARAGVNDPNPHTAHDFHLTAFPNPFNASATLCFDIPKRSDVALRVFDLLGRRVSTLIESTVKAGHHQVLFDGGALASGIYFVRLETSGGSQVRKLALMK